MNQQKDTQNIEDKKFKPVIIENAPEDKHRPNRLKQALLLKAMEQTDDPQQMRKMIGAKSVAEVQRVFDVMANQREHQSALRKVGLTSEYLSGRLKTIIDTAEKTADVLKAIDMVSKSMGVDKVAQESQDTKNWQDLLMNKVKDDYIEAVDEDGMYVVNQPTVPKHLLNEKKVLDADEDEVDEALKKIYE